MNKVTETVENIVQLRAVRDKLQGDDLHRVDDVLRSLRSSLGETVTKSNAAELLGVSRQTLDRWIEEGVLPAIRLANGRQQILASSLERMLVDLQDIRKKNIDGKILPRLRLLQKEAASKLNPRKPSSAASKTASKTTPKKKTASKTTPKNKTASKTTPKKKASTKAASSKSKAASSRASAKKQSTRKAIPDSEKKSIPASQKKPVPESEKKRDRRSRRVTPS